MHVSPLIKLGGQMFTEIPLFERRTRETMPRESASGGPDSFFASLIAISVPWNADKIPRALYNHSGHSQQSRRTHSAYTVSSCTRCTCVHSARAKIKFHSKAHVWCGPGDWNWHCLSPLNCVESRVIPPKRFAGKNGDRELVKQLMIHEFTATFGSLFTSTSLFPSPLALEDAFGTGNIWSNRVTSIETGYLAAIDEHREKSGQRKASKSYFVCDFCYKNNQINGRVKEWGGKEKNNVWHGEADRERFICKSALK